MTTVLSPSVPRTRPASRAPLRRLRLIVLGAMLAPLFLLPSSSDIPQPTRQLAALLWVLCLFPAWHYLRLPASRRPPLPFLPLIGVAMLFYYPLQIVVGQSNVSYLFYLDASNDYARPVEMILIGWIALLVGYYALVLPRHSLSFGGRATVGPRTVAGWGQAMLVAGLSAEFARRVLPVPSVLVGLLNFITSLTAAGVALLVILRVRGELGRRQRLFLYGSVLLAALLRVSQGNISTVIVLALSIVLAIWIAGGRFRMSIVALAILSIGGILAVKGVVLEYRRLSWFGQEKLGPAGEIALMVELVSDRTRSIGVFGTVAEGWNAMATRSASTDLLADIVRQTPSNVPYWGGTTYLSLIGVAVPRVIWPNKPIKKLGQDFGHRYGYLDPYDTSTSVNLPYLVEFYANFGELGVLFGMLLVGVIYRVLDSLLNSPGQPIQNSVCAIVLLAPLTNIESDFSLIFGGLFLNGATLWLVFRWFEIRSRVAARRSNPAPAVIP
jgi:hypothetical protein